MLTFRAGVDSGSLRISGRQPILISSIRAIDAGDFNKTGRVEIRYDDGGSARSVRLDDYQVMDLKGVVAAICKERGITDPLATTTSQSKGA